jgi:hypothetical protein
MVGRNLQIHGQLAQGTFGAKSLQSIHAAIHVETRDAGAD